MAYLINREGRSFHNFYEDSILYLSFCGLGSANEILNMSMPQIIELKQCMDSEEMIKLRYTMLGVHTS